MDSVKLSLTAFVVAFLGAILMFGLLLMSSSLTQSAMDEACEDLNMERDTKFGDPVCIDEFNEAHFVKIDCKGLINIECKAKIILIGEFKIVD